ncbi:MAG: rod shape-determining protein RodA [Bacteroidota bacterium]
MNNRFLSFVKEYFDFKSFLLCIGLVAVGLLSIYSATFDINNALNFKRQAMWAGVGFFAMLVAAFMPLKTVQRLSLPIYIVSIAILAVVLFAGSTVKGSKSWFAFGGQPSEFAKVATVLAAAAYFARTTVSISNLKDFFVGLAIFFIPMGLVLAQPDLGTTIVFFAALLPILYWAGASNFILLAILVPIMVAAGALFGTAWFLLAVVVSGALLYYFRQNRFAAAVAFGVALAVGLSVQIIFDRMAPYQQKRIATFINPDADPLGAGYNVVQSKIAIGSGGFLGKGYLHGTQTQLNYIPEQWTDFIFCVPGEEFGFLGSSIVLAFFAALLLHSIKIAGISRNKFGSIAAVGISGILVTHVLVNVGMSMGLMPVIGIPLPFLSYGGSALVANMSMVGLLMNFYANRKSY